MVEKWLLQVQQTMIISLKDVMGNAVASYVQDPRRKWVLEWPGQIIIAASTVYWTTDVTDAIKNGTLKVWYDCMSILACMATMAWGFRTTLRRATAKLMRLLNW